MRNYSWSKLYTDKDNVIAQNFPSIIKIHCKVSIAKRLKIKVGSLTRDSQECRHRGCRGIYALSL